MNPIQLFFLLAMLLPLSLQAETTSNRSSNGIDFETVEQVFEAMEANPDAARTDYEGWVIYNIANGGSYTLWSLTPIDHPANPTAIRRDVVSRDGIVNITMSALCQAEKQACDALIDEFREINKGIKQRMEGQAQGS